MTKRLKLLTAAAVTAVFLAAQAAASAPEVGKTAPDFTGVDSNG
ncbi:MAG: thioredoxin family protein, partial [Rhodospirillaceae bacterium]|nr:thioredoxin family protein [Rhodospirillaceae bacterium]